MRLVRKLSVVLATMMVAAAYAQAPKTTDSKALMTAQQQRAFVDHYCSDCHNDDEKTGGMTLTALDFAHPERNLDLAEEVLRKADEVERENQ